MVTTSGIAQIPYPEMSDRVDGPGAFALMARRLDDITVVPYASSTARTAAFAAASSRVPVKGTISFLSDTNVFEYWTGSSWAAILPTNLPRGIINYTYTDVLNPVIASGAEVIISGQAMTVTLSNARVYRISAFVGVVDGAAGSSLSSLGAEFHLKYNASATPATTASPNLLYARSATVADDAQQSDSCYMERIWPAPASGSYSFALSMLVFNSAGVRIIGPCGMTVEDLGLTK